MHKADIVLNVKSHDSHIFIDGKEIKGVTKVVVSQAVGEVPQITLDLLMDAFQIAAEGELNQRPKQRQRPVQRHKNFPWLMFNRPRGWNPYDGCHE